MKDLESIKIEAEIQYNGKAVKRDELLQRILDAWSATGHDVNKVEKINLYMKPAENRAYYVINGVDEGSMFMF